MKYLVLPHLHEFDLICVRFLTKPQVKAPTQKDDKKMTSIDIKQAKGNCIKKKKIGSSLLYSLMLIKYSKLLG